MDFLERLQYLEVQLHRPCQCSTWVIIKNQNKTHTLRHINLCKRMYTKRHTWGMKSPDRQWVSTLVQPLTSLWSDLLPQQRCNVSMSSFCVCSALNLISGQRELYSPLIMCSRFREDQGRCMMWCPLQSMMKLKSMPVQFRNSHRNPFGTGSHACKIHLLTHATYGIL